MVVTIDGVQVDLDRMNDPDYTRKLPNSIYLKAMNYGGPSFVEPGSARAGGYTEAQQNADVAALRSGAPMGPGTAARLNYHNPALAQGIVKDQTVLGAKDMVGAPTAGTTREGQQIQAGDMQKWQQEKQAANIKSAQDKLVAYYSSNPQALESVDQLYVGFKSDTPEQKAQRKAEAQRLYNQIKSVGYKGERGTLQQQSRNVKSLVPMSYLR